MRRITVIDAETDPFRKGRVPKPFIWGFYDGREYREFSSTAKLAAFLAEHDFICFAHNGGKFDFHYLLEYLTPYDDISIINGRIAKMFIGKCELRDSYCIIPEKLAAYQKDEIDYALFEADVRRKRANWRKIRAYLQSDCLYLYQMVTAFIEKFGDHLTVAGAAMKQWQILEKTAEHLPADETGKEFYNEISPWYFGGRVECFESGIIDTDFAVYDINSAYPYAMLRLHPYSATYERAAGYARNADFYRLRCISFGAFPYRESGSEHGLHFPRDNTEREYFVTQWEYAAATDTRTIRNVLVLESLTFTRHTTFENYIDKFWTEREAAKAAGDKLGSLFAKRLMNALYGKWGANPENYRNYVIARPEDASALEEEDSRYSFGGELGPWILAQKPLDPEKERYYNVATGASITGFVRAMLWRAIHSSKGVLYADTDAIACKVPGSQVRLGTALGEWKIEGLFDRAGIAGKKLYIFRGAKGQRDEKGKHLYKTASKGARLTHAQLWRVAAGGIVDYESDTPTYSVVKAPTFVNRTIKRTT